MHKLYDFIEARERLTTVVVKTKLIHSPVFSEESGNEIYLKPENQKVLHLFFYLEYLFR